MVCATFAQEMPTIKPSLGIDLGDREDPTPQPVTATIPVEYNRVSDICAGATLTTVTVTDPTGQDWEVYRDKSGGYCFPHLNQYGFWVRCYLK